MKHYVRNDAEMLELLEIPEVERYWRLAYWEGFFSWFGMSPFHHAVEAAREESFTAICDYLRNKGTLAETD